MSILVHYKHHWSVAQLLSCSVAQLLKQEGIQSAKIEADRIDKEVTKAVLFAEKLVALKLYGYG